MTYTAQSVGTRDVESIRKRARILVIDDQEWPYEAMFTRDRYHVERWPTVRDLSQLTDGHYSIILLDINGVGLEENKQMQGMGILDHIKTTNPAQRVIVYSARKQAISAAQVLNRADAIFDKSESYLAFKEEIDRFLVSGASPAYFIAAMNRQLGEDAASAPRAVAKAIAAFKSGRVDRLTKYLGSVLSDRKKVETIAFIISVGVKTIRDLQT